MPDKAKIFLYLKKKQKQNKRENKNVFPIMPQKI